MPNCKLTNVPFEISEKDLAFYEKLGVPAPEILPAKRLQQRLTFRNERSLYRRACSKTGENTISIYAPDS